MGAYYCLLLLPGTTAWHYCRLVLPAAVACCFSLSLFVLVVFQKGNAPDRGPQGEKLGCNRRGRQAQRARFNFNKGVTDAVRAPLPSAQHRNRPATTRAVGHPNSARRMVLKCRVPGASGGILESTPPSTRAPEWARAARTLPSREAAAGSVRAARAQAGALVGMAGVRALRIARAMQSSEAIRAR